LNKLLIRFTKSRPRHPDDNGLVEWGGMSITYTKPSHAASNP
jgi:hypothetical protein